MTFPAIPANLEAVSVDPSTLLIATGAAILLLGFVILRRAKRTAPTGCEFCGSYHSCLHCPRQGSRLCPVFNLVPLLIMALMLTGCTLTPTKRPVFVFVHDLAPADRAAILDAAKVADDAAAHATFHP